MKKPNLNQTTVLLCMSILLAALPAAQSQELEKQWKDPFPSRMDTSTVNSDSLTLDMVLRLVAQGNSSLRANRMQREAAHGLVRQANLRPNPELEFEAEDVGGDLTGFRESEMTIVLSQELELWGQRRTRRKVALGDAERVEWETRVEDFDTYVEAKLRFYALLHAQKKLELAEEAARLAFEVAEATGIRVQKGAALHSELLLGQLGFERARAEVMLAETEVGNARRNLAGLWRGGRKDFKVVESDPVGATLPDLTILKSYLPESREVVGWSFEEANVNAQLNLEKTNRLPTPTLSGGYKRSEVDRTNTYLVGLGIPLPLFNRNQGAISSLRLQSEAVKSAREQALVNTEVELEAAHQRLSTLLSSRASLENLILPKAEEAYQSLKRAYELGRIPYATLLEGERSLIEVRFELNDLDLATRQEIVALERLLGIDLRYITNN
ncbi:MAG: TolC family protein [Deltaproteobacteria bacterium]|nr:MAG: TolC family protein [Deltaproteobacteria bacterium]